MKLWDLTQEPKFLKAKVSVLSKSTIAQSQGQEQQSKKPIKQSFKNLEPLQLVLKFHVDRGQSTVLRLFPSM